jgi:hypothetical protein
MRIWFFEVGFLYLIALALVVVFFALRELGSGLPSIRKNLSNSAQQEAPPLYPATAP